MRLLRLSAGWTAAGGGELSEQALLDLAADRPGRMLAEIGSGRTVAGLCYAAPRRRWSGTTVEIAAAADTDRAMLVRLVVEAMRTENVPPPRHLWTATEEEARAARACGLRTGRRLLRVARQLPLEVSAELPPGFDLRPYLPEMASPWLAANNRAFGLHPDNGDWNLDDVADRLSQPWFDAAGFLTAWRGTDLAAANWTKVHPRGVGEIYVVFVDPQFQGIRLGKAITVAGLRHLGEVRGCMNAHLHVEADNRRALRMYLGLGFTEEAAATVYVDG
ncbi:MAG: GNAT family N-acetyltransferase [Acidimicrobiia bacterium]